MLYCSGERAQRRAKAGAPGTTDQRGASAMRCDSTANEAAQVKCNKCQEFRDWNGGVGWKSKSCPECTRAYDRARHAEDPQRGRAKFKRWKDANPERVRQMQRDAKRVERERALGSKGRSAPTDATEELGDTGRLPDKASKIPVPQTGSNAPAPAPLSPRCKVCRRALVYYPDYWTWFCQGCGVAKAVRQ